MRWAHCHEFGEFERLLSRVDGGFAMSSPSRNTRRSVWVVGCESKLAELPLLPEVFAIPPIRGAGLRAHAM